MFCCWRSGAPQLWQWLPLPSPYQHTPGWCLCSTPSSHLPPSILSPWAVTHLFQRSPKACWGLWRADTLGYLFLLEITGWFIATPSSQASSSLATSSPLADPCMWLFPQNSMSSPRFSTPPLAILATPWAAAINAPAKATRPSLKYFFFKAPESSLQRPTGPFSSSNLARDVSDSSRWSPSFGLLLIFPFLLLSFHLYTWVPQHPL